EHVRAQILEMVRLTEEGGQIRGDGIAELHQLCGIALEKLAILPEGSQVQGAQAPRQARVHELALRISKIDTRHLLDELAQGEEIPFAKLELAQPLGGRYGQVQGFRAGHLRNLAMVASRRSSSNGLSIQPVAPASRPSSLRLAADSVVRKSSGVRRY